MKQGISTAGLWGCHIRQHQGGLADSVCVRVPRQIELKRVQLNFQTRPMIGRFSRPINVQNEIHCAVARLELALDINFPIFEQLRLIKEYNTFKKLNIWAIIF